MASLKVMSFNVRFDNPNEEPQDAWDARKGTCAAIIAKYRPHLLGLQEPHRHQCEQLAEMLPNYGWYGT
jgi:endonuclease/exonuclease/phosphatase family metal-dependent hydrolase